MLKVKQLRKLARYDMHLLKALRWHTIICIVGTVLLALILILKKIVIKIPHIALVLCYVVGSFVSCVYR